MLKPRTTSLLAFWLAACLAWPCMAQSAPPMPEADEDDDRYPSRWLVPGILDAIWRLPQSTADWTPPEWGQAAAVGGSTLALMWPDGLPADVRLQSEVRTWQSPAADRFFPKITAPASIVGYSGVIGALALTGWATGSDRLLKYDALLIESLAVTGFYVQLSKAMTGRDAPYRDPTGTIHGPRLQLPTGTPSGHQASLYAALTVTAFYWRSRPLKWLMHGIGVWYGINLVYNEQHYASDAIWGAALGYGIGRWIVHHHGPGVEDSAESGFVVVPTPLPHGVALMFALAR